MKLSLASARAAFARARAWPLTRPLLKGALGGVVLLILVIVGRATFAGAQPKTIHEGDAQPSAQPSSEPAAPDISASSAEPPPVATAPPAGGEAPVLELQAQPTSHGPATADDPVFLNEASMEDLQRLPGVGQKRALAILDLRTRLGHFRQVEDLLKVRGIGLKTLRRLRPLIRLDRPAPKDAGSG